MLCFGLGGLVSHRAQETGRGIVSGLAFSDLTGAPATDPAPAITIGPPHRSGDGLPHAHVDCYQARLGVLNCPECSLVSCFAHAQSHHSSAQIDTGPSATVRVSLKAYGLPDPFFQPGFDSKCSSQIIQYRFVVWLDIQNVAVGFSTSPNCRVSPDRPVNGVLRVLVFDLSGTLKANRNISYLADGNGELVADGEAMPGPNGTLLIRVESVNLDQEGRHESPSGIRLLDSRLQDVMQRDGFLEQTTFVDHALVFQDSFTMSGPRTYSILDGPGAKVITHPKVDWPTGSMDRKFGEHELAFISCGQELNPGQYTTTNVVHAGARFRCALNVLGYDKSFWTRALQDGDTAALVGILADGSVVGQLHAKDTPERLVIWKKDQTPEPLPWLPPHFEGSLDSAARDFSRYASLASADEQSCNPIARVFGDCTESGDGRWYVFDRKFTAPIVNRTFPGNGRAALSPDGAHYASFEGGELRIFSLPN